MPRDYLEGTAVRECRNVRTQRTYADFQSFALDEERNI